jgi:hypothetical protein
MSKLHFPSWRYHRNLEAKIVQNEAEANALGDGWAMSPAHFESEAEPESNFKLTTDVDIPKPQKKKSK